MEKKKKKEMYSGQISYSIALIKISAKDLKENRSGRNIDQYIVESIQATCRLATCRLSLKKGRPDEQ